MTHLQKMLGVILKETPYEDQQDVAKMILNRHYQSISLMKNERETKIEIADMMEKMKKGIHISTLLSKPSSTIS